MPEGWAWERLSNLAAFSGGKTPSTSHREFWDGEILWVTSKDMKNKYITFSQLRLSVLGAEQMQMYQPDTLLLVTRSGILRHTLPVSILKERATINQDLKAIVLYMPQLADLDVYRITYDGYQFIETIRPEPVWAKVKSTGKHIGSFSIDVITRVATTVLTSMINGYLTGALNL